jgi:hypothetical protein
MLPFLEIANQDRIGRCVSEADDIKCGQIVVLLYVSMCCVSKVSNVVLNPNRTIEKSQKEGIIASGESRQKSSPGVSVFLELTAGSVCDLIDLDFILVCLLFFLYFALKSEALVSLQVQTHQ